MPEPTSLPVPSPAGTTDHPGIHGTIHSEINRLSGDTGLRDISGLLINGWKIQPGGYFLIRRAANTVSVLGFRLSGRDATDTTLIDYTGGTLSAGFMPAVGTVATTTMSPTYRPATGQDPWYLFILNTFAMGIGQGSSAAIVLDTGSSAFQWDFYTDRAWPSYLPPAA